MELYNRRQVLTGISAGLAAAGIGAALPAGSASAAAATLVKENVAVKHSSVEKNVASSLEGADGPVVAYLRDARSGEISLFVGSRELTLHDTGIAAKLADAASKGA
jgi:hypothetical protein